MDRKSRQKIQRIAKLVSYALSRAPDEFGLIPDEDGFVSLKEIRQALSEEEGWGFLRLSHLQEMLLHDRWEHFETREEQIRSIERQSHIGVFETIHPPKILYFAVRSRAWPHVAVHGLKPYADRWVVLARSKEMAIRMGKRRDPDPILLEIHSKRSQSQGMPFFACGKELVTTPTVSHHFISGPPVPPKEKETRPPVLATEPDQPGSYLLDPERDLRPSVSHRIERKGKKARQERVKHARRQARKFKKKGSG